MVLAAARKIVFETSHHAQAGTLDAEDIEALEIIVSEAIAEAHGRSPASISTIARDLYWKLNPLGTVPPSFYADANFGKLADLISGIVSRPTSSEARDMPVVLRGTPEQLAPYASARAPLGLTPENVETIDDLFKNIGGDRDTVAEDALEFEMPTIVEPEPAPALPAASDAARLNAISAVLIGFIEDLSDVITVKPEWRGREAEAIRKPAQIAAQRLSQMVATRNLIDTGITREFVSIVPQDWAEEIVSWLLARIEAATTVIWTTTDSRDCAIRKAALKVGRRLTELSDQTPEPDNFGNVASLDDAQGWTRHAAGEVYQMLLEDDFHPYTMIIGTAMKQEAFAYLQKSIFENVYPAIIFRGPTAGPVAHTPPSTPLPKSEPARRESWKMPWSVARDIVQDLCQRSGNEDAFLATFKDWLGLPDAGSEEIRNELISEVLARGRQAEAVEEVQAPDLPPVTFVYQNWKGDVAVRNAVPIRVIHASNEWHRERQWLLEAMDLDRQETRTFALEGIIKFLQKEE